MTIFRGDWRQKISISKFTFILRLRVKKTLRNIRVNGVIEQTGMKIFTWKFHACRL
jgi:hypothetical protein